MSQVKKMVDDISDEKQTKSEILDFIRALESELGKVTQLSERSGVLETLLSSERNITLSGASVKMILEGLALVLPTLGVAPVVKS